MKLFTRLFDLPESGTRLQDCQDYMIHLANPVNHVILSSNKQQKAQRLVNNEL